MSQRRVGSRAKLCPVCDNVRSYDAKDDVREDLGGPRSRRWAAVHRPAPGARGDKPAGVRRAAASRTAGAPARPHAGHCRPQHTHRRHACRRAHQGRALARTGGNPRAQLRRVRRARLLAGLRAPGDRARDRARAGGDPAGHDDRLRRLAHLNAWRVRGSGLRDRHLRGRARAGHPVHGPATPTLDAHPLRGRAWLRRDSQGSDPRHAGPAGCRWHDRPRRRVRGPRDRGALDGRPHDRLQHDDRGRRSRRHDRAG